MSLQVLDRNKQRVSLEAKNVPQDHIITCNSTPLVHQDMTKKTTFLWKNLGEIIQVKCKIGLWFLSSVLPFINIYVCTKTNFNPFRSFQDMARISNHYEKMVNGRLLCIIQGRVMVLVHCTSSHCHLFMYQVSFQSLLYFPRYGSDRCPLWKMV